MWILKGINKAQLLMEMSKEIDWNLRLMRMAGSQGELRELRRILEGVGIFFP